MKIYIIGAGAIGKALAVFLKRKSKEVVLVRGSVDDLPNETHDITVVGTDAVVTERITTTTFSGLSTMDGIVLLTTKSFANIQMAEKLSKMAGDFSIVLLQNGLQIERPFRRFDKVYRCVLFSTSQVTGEHEVTFKAVKASPIGNLEGKNEGLDELIAHIDTPEFAFRKEEHLKPHVWTKVIANCVFNTLCPLLETDNGVFHRNPTAMDLAKTIIRECASIAHLQGVNLDENAMFENLLVMSQKSDGQLISTYMDILNKRRTEIESLNLEIAAIGRELGRPELVQKTEVLGQLIQLKASLQA